MLFPSMSTQQLVKLSSDIVNLGFIALRRCASRRAPPAEPFQTYVRSRGRYPTSTKFDRFLPTKNDGIYSVALKRACDLY